MGARAIVMVAKVAAIGTGIVLARLAEIGPSHRNRRIVRARERKVATVATVATIVRSRKPAAMLLQPNARRPCPSPNRSNAISRLLPSSAPRCRRLRLKPGRIVRRVQKVLLQMVSAQSVVAAAAAVAAVVVEVVVKKAPVDRVRRAAISRTPTIGHPMGRRVRRKVAVKTLLRALALRSSHSEASICPLLPPRRARSITVNANTKKERHHRLLRNRLKVHRSRPAIRRSSGRPARRPHRVRGVVRASPGATSDISGAP